jgi:alanine-glyoxylate transaminase / serine-glyoxylate transaminase / serine-pyruvate transaminase
MNNLLERVEALLLMGPGPSSVRSSVYSALARPTLGHLDPSFIEIMDGVKELLRAAFGTANRLTLPVSGTGSAGMEAAFANLVESGTQTLVLVNGTFGARMAEVARRLGANVETLEFSWGTPVVLEDVERALRARPYGLVAVVHAETSTGVCNPVAEIGALARSTGALFLVDAVTSLGGMPVEVDAWGVDAVYSGTQKCLSCPPGLSPASFSERALRVMRARKTKVPSWYFDMSQVMQYWDGAKRAYHHTAPVNMIYGLYQALIDLLDEGLPAAFARHRAAHAQLVGGLEALGLTMLVPAKSRLPMLNAVRIPDGIRDLDVRERLRREFHIEIGGGLGPLAGKIWRIGLMGHTARAENVERLLGALRTCLNR